MKWWNESEKVFDYEAIKPIVQKIIDLTHEWIQVSIVVWGWNIWRHRDNIDSGIPRHVSDQIWICATVINAAVLVQTINAMWSTAVCLTDGSISSPHLSELYTASKGHKQLNKGKIVVCAWGTGHCYATTDSGAVVRALELECDLIVKWTKVDGIYDKDPMKYSDAVRFSTMNFKKALDLWVDIMDHSAIALAQDYKLPIYVCKIEDIDKLISDEVVGTYVDVDAENK